MIEEIFIVLELVKIFIFFGWLFGQFDEFNLIGILRLKRMNSYLEQFKQIKYASKRDDLEDIIEDMLSIIAKDRGNNYVISLLGDYLQSLEERIC